MTKDDIRDVAIFVTEYLLDNAHHLLSEHVLEVRDEFGGLTYTPETFELQDCIFDALTKNLKR